MQPEVVIDGVRATSRQLALKEKEVMMKVQEQKRQPETMFVTPKKPKKTKVDSGENPQAGAEKAPIRKTEHLPESSPKIIRDKLMESFSNKNGDTEDKMDWAVFTRCQILLSRVSAKAADLQLESTAKLLHTLEQKFRTREQKFESGLQVTRAMREIICNAIAKENKTSGPLVELYSYFIDQCEEAFVDEHNLIQGKELAKPADKTDGVASKTSSPFSSVSSDDLLDDGINSSSESDDMRYEVLKKAQAAERKGIQQQVQPEPKPKTCTIIRLPKPKPQNELSEDEKKYVAENVGKLDMKNSEGIREVVKNHVTPDADGNMDFELEQLPYEVGKNLYRYIKACL